MRVFQSECAPSLLIRVCQPVVYLIKVFRLDLFLHHPVRQLGMARTDSRKRDGGKTCFASFEPSLSVKSAGKNSRQMLCRDSGISPSIWCREGELNPHGLSASGF